MSDLRWWCQTHRSSADEQRPYPLLNRTCDRVSWWIDNNHGKYPPWPPDGWWITEGCPLHDRPLEDT